MLQRSTLQCTLLGTYVVLALGCSVDKEPPVLLKVASTSVVSAGKTSPFMREDHPTVRLEAELTGLPQGRAADFTCEWRTQDGALQHENRWQTRTVDRAQWNTHCRFRIEPSAPTGTWSITMKHLGQTVTKAEFDVR